MTAPVRVRVSRWSRPRQWQWVEDYCAWLDDGLSPLQASKVMTLHAQEYGLQAEAQLAARMHQHLSQGLPIASALKGVLADDVAVVFELGQQSHCLTELIHHYQQLAEQRWHLRMALWRQRLYPMFVMALVVAAVIVAGTSYFPRLSEFMVTPPSHWSIQIVEASAHWLSYWGLFAAGGMLLMLWGYAWLARSWLSKRRVRLEGYGVFSMHRGLAVVWVTQMLALLLKHRVSLQLALQRLTPLGDSYTRWHIEQMAKRVANGEQQLAAVMNTGLLEKSWLFRLSNCRQHEAAVRVLWRTALRSQELVKRRLLRRQAVLLGVLYGAIFCVILLLLSAAGKMMMALLGAASL